MDMLSNLENRHNDGFEICPKEQVCSSPRIPDQPACSPFNTPICCRRRSGSLSQADAEAGFEAFGHRRREASGIRELTKRIIGRDLDCELLEKDI